MEGERRVVVLEEGSGREGEEWLEYDCRGESKGGEIIDGQMFE